MSTSVPSSSRLLALPALLVVALLVVGCGTATVNTTKAESVLKQKVVAQTGVAIASVSCPADVPAKKGGTFTCVAHGADGTSAPINVTQTDDQGNVEYSADLVHQNLVESKITEYLTSKSISVSSVRCPAVVAYAAGKQFTCTLTSTSGQTAHATVTLKEGGAFDFSIGS